MLTYIEEGIISSFSCLSVNLLNKEKSYEQKALLIGVANYLPELHAPNLLLCKNDIIAMRKSLLKGLKMSSEEISVVGSDLISIEQFVKSLQTMERLVKEDETFIFYFTGHGGKDCLLLSDGMVELQSVIDYIEKSNAKNKIIILDCCHSGGFELGKTPELAINESVEKFVGYGYAVFASCGAAEMSGFNDERKISTYTSFVCDAIESPYIIRKGKKSLEDINRAIYQYSQVWNQKRPLQKQTHIFRENIGGTIFFDVDKYEPYITKKIYLERDDYIIYDVEPVHIPAVKRLSVKVLLRYPCTKDEIAHIAKCVVKEVLYADVYKNEKSERHFMGKAANIIGCYFGYDDDMIDPNFVFHTIWVDDTQDKEHWYTEAKNKHIIDGVCVEVNKSYEMVKRVMHEDEVDTEQFVANIRTLMAKLTNAGESYLRKVREYKNQVISEELLIQEVKVYNKEINALYLELTDADVPPKELHDWFLINEQIAGDIHDYSLFYNKKFM